jgi:chromosome segregation ATPase
MPMLRKLRDIKVFRERKAQTEVQRAARALEQASQRLDDEKRALRQLRIDTREREDALYADLFSRVVLKSDIDDVKFKVGELREHLAAREKDLDAVAQALRVAADARDGAVRQHRLAIRQREKFDEIVAQADADAAHERQRIEDLELEEVRVAGPEQFTEEFA